jgi:hypothetical protein
MNTKHTPGPWHTYEHPKTFSVYDKNGGLVSTGAQFGVASKDRRKADSRLIAAAPDLLAALKALEAAAFPVKPAESKQERQKEIDALRQARAAIAAAESK